jgi:leader peptidase (prepilin peptidase)/N-methyltransferase
MRHKIIPDRFVYSFSAITLLSVFLSPESIIAIPEGVWQALFAGPMLAMPFALLWLISGGKWVGLGDAKLSLGLGWMLGVTKSISVFLLSFWIGAIISVAIVLFERYCTPHSSLSRTHGRLTMKGEVPFAPFLILGTGLVFLFGADIVALFLW